MSASYNAREIVNKYFDKQGNLLQWHWEPKTKTVNNLRRECTRAVYNGGLNNDTHPLNELYSLYTGWNMNLFKNLKELADWENNLIYKCRGGINTWNS